MRRPTPRLLALLHLATLAILGTGCAQEPTAAEQAQTFWDAVAAERLEAAREVAIAGDADAQRDRLEDLGVAGAEVERLDVPPEAEVALLPTRVERSDLTDDDAPLVVETTTVLRRTDAGWRVDLEATVVEYRTASVSQVGEQIADAAGRLGDALGRGTAELGAALERLGRDLGELVAGERDGRSEEFATELGRRLEHAGEALTRGIEEMERALREADAARERETDDPEGDREP
jgi:hypothetical protein